MSSHPPLRIQIGTFNYNLRGDPQKATPDLRQWLVPTRSESDPNYGTAHGPVPGAQGADREAPDIYAVGFQEHLPLNIGLSGSGKGTPVVPLVRGAENILDDTDLEIRRAIRPHAAVVSKSGLYPEKGGPENYTLLARINMAGITLFVYGRERSGVPERVKEIRANVVGTGILGLLGNKGAVGIRLVLGPLGASSAEKLAENQVLTFVCAHLSAHDHNVARRAQDYASIVSRLAFPPDKVLPIPTASPPLGAASKPADLDQLKQQYTQHQAGPKKRPAVALDDKTYCMYDSSSVFFFGDLNYRIGINTPPRPDSNLPNTATLTPIEVVDGVRKQDWGRLSNYDQLSIEHLSGRVLQGLTEVPLEQAGFGPTYKYKIFEAPAAPAGSPALVVTPEQTHQLSPKRVPGWCDRIFWRSWADGTEESPLARMSANKVELYRSVMSYTVRHISSFPSVHICTNWPIWTALGPQAGYCHPHSTFYSSGRKRTHRVSHSISVGFIVAR